LIWQELAKSKFEFKLELFLIFFELLLSLFSFNKLFLGFSSGFLFDLFSFICKELLNKNCFSLLLLFI
jgi:hypothetical protein